MHILIADDEKPARDKLRRLLNLHAPDSHLLEARNGGEALQNLTNNAVDLVFLDIQMPEMDGLEIAARLTSNAPVIVFVTACDQFALQAFDLNAIDYLLKPYDEARFLKALQKAMQKLTQHTAAQSVHSTNIGMQAAAPLLISERGRVIVIAPAEIVRIEAADNYVQVVTHTSQHLLRQSLSGMAEKLGMLFSRCHRRHLVRISEIVQILANGKGDGELLLKNGERLPLSRQYRQDLLAQLETAQPDVNWNVTD